MSKGSWRRTGGRVSAVDPEDGDRYHHVDKSPARLLNSFGVLKFYPTSKYGDNLERILKKEAERGKKRETTDATSEAD